MRLTLKDFQRVAVDDLVTRLREAASLAAPRSLQAVVLSAPTGAGKTVIATRLIERIIEGDDHAPPNSDVAFLWITDLPELNLQTRDKMLDISDVLSPFALTVIKSSFDRPRLPAGHIYFLNTQKLGRDKLLTTLGDRRQYTIWQTLDNTIEQMGSRFVVIIDEAHRGMRTRRDEAAAATIIQKFLMGSDEMRKIPLVLGISATPQRFNDLIKNKRAVHPVHVDSAEVRASGLLKDRIVLYHRADSQRSDMTLLREATRHWREYTERWEAYCAERGEQPVVPLFIVQVENAPTGKKGTSTDLAAAIRAINDQLPVALPTHAFAHAFEDPIVLDVDGFTIRHLAPSRIDGDRDARVVFFKTALSTGWNCPRAETIMSYRKARDATHIAQLIGRMVRTPLARRIETDESLNSVALFLPHYDTKAVKSMVKYLTDPDHEHIPIPIETSEETVSLRRADSSEAIYQALAQIPSYIIPTIRKTKQVNRMMRMARALTQDKIAESAIQQAKNQVCRLLGKQLTEKRGEQSFVDQVRGKALISYGARVYDMTKQKYVDTRVHEVAAAPENIDHIFEEAGRKIGEGLHRDFWQTVVAGINDIAQIRHAKIEIAALLADPAIAAAVEDTARNRVDRWRQQFADDIDRLPAKRHATYDSIALMADLPSETKIRYPNRVEWKRSQGSDSWKKHLYVDERGYFPDDFNQLEKETLNIEIPNCVAWLRNPDRKPWSLAIPYERTPGEHKPLYPDFLFFRRTGNKIEIDMLDPHGAHLPDAASKAKGLVVYAKKHGHRFGRIELVDRIEGQLRRLDVKNHKIQQHINTTFTSDGLVTLYKTQGNKYL